MLNFWKQYLIHWLQAFSYEGILSQIIFATIVPLSYAGGGTLPRNTDGSFQTTYKVNLNVAWTEMEKLLDRGKV